MTLKHHFRMTASELAVGRYMRAPDHSAADDEFAQAFTQFKNEPAAGAADDKGGTGDGTGGAGEPAPAGEPGSADGGAGDGSGADDAGAVAPAADDKDGAGAAPGAKVDGADATAAGKAKPGAGDGAAPAAEPDASAALGEPAAAAADGKSGKAKAPAAAAPAASESDDDVLKRLAAAVKKVDTAEAPDATVDKPQDQPLFTTEEEGKIEHFRKEWPEVAEAFDLQSRAVAQSVLKYAFEQIGSIINPMRETLDILATRTHYGDLKDKVGEYTAEERDEIVGWVKEQPTYLQTPMMSVIDGGTAEEVADLVGRYRKETGKQPAGAQGDPPGPSGGDVELSDEAKKAAAALAPVSTKRSAVQAPDDKSDFNGAFAKFADELG